MIEEIVGLLGSVAVKVRLKPSPDIERLRRQRKRQRMYGTITPLAVALDLRLNVAVPKASGITPHALAHGRLVRSENARSNISFRGHLDFLSALGP
jgi:hypothetical protein